MIFAIYRYLPVIHQLEVYFCFFVAYFCDGYKRKNKLNIKIENHDNVRQIF